MCICMYVCVSGENLGREIKENMIRKELAK